MRVRVLCRKVLSLPGAGPPNGALIVVACATVALVSVRFVRLANWRDRAAVFCLVSSAVVVDVYSWRSKHQQSFREMLNARCSQLSPC